MRRSIGMAVLVTALAGGSVFAEDEVALTIGDPVPAIDLSHYFQGDPVKAVDKEGIYVLEFWATW